MNNSFSAWVFFRPREINIIIAVPTSNYTAEVLVCQGIEQELKVAMCPSLFYLGKGKVFFWVILDRVVYPIPG